MYVLTSHVNLHFGKQLYKIGVIGFPSTVIPSYLLIFYYYYFVSLWQIFIIIIKAHAQLIDVLACGQYVNVICAVI